MDLDELSPELKEKVKACKTKEELVAVLKTEGVELAEEQLEALSGGADCQEGWVEPVQDDVETTIARHTRSTNTGPSRRNGIPGQG